MRVKISGNYLTYTEYEREPVARGRNHKKKARSTGVDRQRRAGNVYQSRQRLIDVVSCNFGKYPPTQSTFLTLTFEEEVENYTTASREFTLFIKRLRSFFCIQPLYVSVAEIQEKRFRATGKKVWHFHVVFFNVPFLEKKQVEEVWGHGFVWWKGNLEGVKHIGLYISKYLTKQGMQDRPPGAKAFFSSRGLRRPKLYKDDRTVLWTAQNLITKEGCALISKREYETAYLGKIKKTVFKLKENGQKNWSDYTNTFSGSDSHESWELSRRREVGTSVTCQLGIAGVRNLHARNLWQRKDRKASEAAREFYRKESKGHALIGPCSRCEREIADAFDGHHSLV